MTTVMPAIDVSDQSEWIGRALCAQTDPESFFPDKGGSTKEAKRICLMCEVSDECLIYALEHDERFGIWGGLSERERRRLKKGDATVLRKVDNQAEHPDGHSYKCYQKGCRHPLCRAAKNEYEREWRHAHGMHKTRRIGVSLTPGSERHTRSGVGGN